MNEERKKIVLQWLYDECSHKWFTLNVLDPIMNKAGNPPCDLSRTEILSIFETLRREEYILPAVNQFGRSCYILNEMKQSEWIDKIENTAPTNEKVVGDFVKSGLLHVLREFGAGFSGGLVAFVITWLFQK